MLLELDALDLRFADLRVRDRARSARMRASIAVHGQLSPVVVVVEGSGTERTYVLVDGYERVAALDAIAADFVTAVVIEEPLADVLVLSHRLDESGSRSALEEGWLLDLLVREHGVTQRDLALRLGRSPSWVSRRLSLVQVLPDSVQRAVREGRIPSHAAEKYLVPLARANRSSCNTIVTSLGRERVSDRDVQRLYDVWRAGTETERSEVEASPILALRICTRRAAQSGGETERLVRDLDTIGSTARRAHERGLLGIIDLENARLRRALAEARRAVAVLFDTLEGERLDARPRHSNGDPADAQGGDRRARDRTYPADLSQRGT